MECGKKWCMYADGGESTWSVSSFYVWVIQNMRCVVGKSESKCAGE